MVLCASSSSAAPFSMHRASSVVSCSSGSGRHRWCCVPQVRRPHHSRCTGRHIWRRLPQECSEVHELANKQTELAKIRLSDRAPALNPTVAQVRWRFQVEIDGVQRVGDLPGQRGSPPAGVRSKQRRDAPRGDRDSREYRRRGIILVIAAQSSRNTRLMGREHHIWCRVPEV